MVYLSISSFLEVWVLQNFFLSLLLILIFNRYGKYFLLYFISYFNIRTDIYVC